MNKLNSIRRYLLKLQKIKRLASERSRRKNYFYRAESEKFNSVQGAIRDRLVWENSRYAS